MSSVSPPVGQSFGQSNAGRGQHILVVDDDNRIRDLLKQFLVQEGYRISLAADAAEARRLGQGLAFDLCIVDVMMPGEDGVSLTEHLRATTEAPVLMLTARSEIEDRITGLQAGAEDYLSKPFDPRELLLRIAVILSRRPAEEAQESNSVSFGPYVFDLHTGGLTRDGQQVRLTERERDLLRALADAQGEPVSREDLADLQQLTSGRAVDVQLNRLRQKIEDEPSAPLFLQTVRGHGYRLILTFGAD